VKFRYKEPSVGLEVGSLPSDQIGDAIRNVKGVREVARLTGLSPTTVSQWANGKVMLPWSTAMRICDAVGHSESLWTSTLWDRVSACERLGFDFHDRTNDQPEQTRKENDNG
jgi:transcriptional regulator with XRE-family HTH domain